MQKESINPAVPKLKAKEETKNLKGDNSKIMLETEIFEIAKQLRINLKKEMYLLTYINDFVAKNIKAN